MTATETITARTSYSIREKLTVISIGQGPYSEFHESFSAIQGTHQVKLAHDPATVLSWAKNSAFLPPALIILAENYPRQFTEAELCELSLLWPLTHIVQVVGDWCEGDPRSRFAQPSVIRVLKEEFPLWIRRAEQQRLNDSAPSWQQPSTSSAEHPWLEQNPFQSDNTIQNDGANPRANSISSVAVLSQSHEDHLALIDSLKSFGFCDEKTAEDPPASFRFLNFLNRENAGKDRGPAPPEMVIANIHTSVEVELEQYRLLRHEWPNAAWLFLINFPRPQDSESARDWPGARVLPKPYSLAMLESALNDFCN